MKWYYVEAGQQMGPVDEATLIGMAAGGQIAPDTLVWKEGMANWQPYSEVAPVGAPPAAGGSPLRISRPAVPAPSAAAGAEEAVCAECGQLFPVAETIRIGDARVCANCKPIFVQKMREGLTVGTVSMRYAGFWIRFAAKMLDGFIIGAVVIVPVVILLIVVGVTAGVNSRSGGFIQTGGFSAQAAAVGGPQVLANVLGLFAQLVFVAANAVYSAFFLGKFGATPGKMVCKIKVVDASGDKIGYGRGFGRGCAEIVSRLICSIGYIMAAFDDEKRALHDRMCNTRVIYK